MESAILYRHSVKKDWGLAILAWEEGDRRAYQFEDGQLRLFKEGYYHLLEEVEEPKGSEEIIDRLYRDLAVQEAHRQATREARRTGEKILSLDDQVTVFLYQYPGGFDGEEWQTELRQPADGRFRKRHRNRAMGLAEELLTPATFEEALESGRYADQIANIVKVWQSTDLASSAETKKVLAGSRRVSERLVSTCFDLLHGEGDYGPRLTAWRVALEERTGGTVSWQLVTSLPALLYPNRHVCVRLQPFREQARTLSAQTEVTKQAEKDVYQALLVMARALRGHLVAQKYKPQDLLDIYDFIRVTMSAAAKKKLAEAVGAS